MSIPAQNLFFRSGEQNENTNHNPIIVEGCCIALFGKFLHLILCSTCGCDAGHRCRELSVHRLSELGRAPRSLVLVQSVCHSSARRTEFLHSSDLRAAFPPSSVSNSFQFFSSFQWSMPKMHRNQRRWSQHAMDFKGRHKYFYFCACKKKSQYSFFHRFRGFNIKAY